MTKKIGNYIIEINNIIGKGSFGTVYKGYNEKNPNEKVAIKKILNDISFTNVNVRDEISVLENLSKNPQSLNYMARILGHYLVKEKNRYYYYIVSEYIEGLTLENYLITKNNFNNNKEELWKIIKDLIDGLVFIHQNGVAHRDIKLSNIMITIDNKVKYIDFGLSCVRECIIKGCSNICKKNTSGTLNYLAPELLSNNPQYIKIANIYNLEFIQLTDVWSLGIVIYQLSKGLNEKNYKYYPYNNQQLKISDKKNAILNSPLEFTTYNPDPYITYIVTKMVIRDPYKRLSSNHIAFLIYSYFKNNDITIY